MSGQRRPQRRPRRARRAAIRAFGVAAVTAAGVLLIAGAASAHVKVSGTNAVEGQDGLVTFTAPCESDTAWTTKLRVTFPTKTPIVSASTQPMPGWTSQVLTKKLAHPVKTDDGTVDTYVSSIVWTATKKTTGIPPGQFQLFNVDVAFPDASSLSFPALQYYSDGSTVNWNEASTGSAEPEHPAPVLDLARTEPTESADADESASMASQMSSSSSGSGPSWPGIVGLTAGILALLVAGVALARSNRTSAPTP